MVAKAAPAHHEEEDSEPGPKKKSKKGLIIGAVAAVVVLALGGGGTAWYLKSKAAAEDDEEEVKPAKKGKKGDKAEKGEKDKAGKKKEKDKAAKPAVFLPMDNFTVNLRGDRYLQIGLVIQCEDALSSDAAKAQMPVIRSQVLLLLASKTPEELQSPEGKDRLAKELIERIRQPVPNMAELEGLERVHFSAFIIQ